VTVSPDAAWVSYVAPADAAGTLADHVFVARLGGAEAKDVSGGHESETPDWQPLCTIYGTAKRDVILGTQRRDKICGLGGNDVIFGRGGDDVVIGGPGNDCIDGGAGLDWAFGAAGNDILVGRAGGKDVVDGGPGTDTASSDKAAVDVTREIEKALPAAACPRR